MRLAPPGGTRIRHVLHALRRRPYPNLAIDEGAGPPLASLTMRSPDDLSHLLHALAAFLQEHRGCGELDGGAEDEWVWMTCMCGAVISRTLQLTHRH